jgi:two-component system, chemotaxis family, sensor kinase CheA
MTDHTAPAHKAAQDFLEEAEDLVDQLAANLADLADLACSNDKNPELLNSIFRGAHSMKGLAGIFGFSGITQLSHHMESLLDWLRLGKLSLTKPVMRLLFESQSLLKTLLRDIAEKDQTAHANEIAACIARIEDCLSLSRERIGTPVIGQLGLPERVLGSLTEYEQHRLLDNLDKGKNIYSIHVSYALDSFDNELTPFLNLLKSGGEIVSTLPGSDDNIETRIGFDILYGSSQPLEDVLTLLGANDIEVVQLGAPVSGGCTEHTPSSVEDDSIHKTDDTFFMIEELPLFSDGNDALSAKSMSRTVRVDIGKLDELMNIVGELTLTHASINDIALQLLGQGSSCLADDLANVSRMLERRLAALRKGVMEIRMVPVGQLYEKLSLAVRAISRELGKMVDLKLFGADMELDKLIVEEISDPMVHIIRNAIDHGIETPEQRAALCKNETATISITAFQKDNHVIIEVEDDGNGIDLERVKAIALRKGLIRSVTGISDREALEFIFLPGFSTTDRVSNVSGRGVGLDVVRNNISAISGIVDIETGKGTGTRFRITLPVTLYPGRQP